MSQKFQFQVFPRNSFIKTSVLAEIPQIYCLAPFCILYSAFDRDPHPSYDLPPPCASAGRVLKHAAEVFLNYLPFDESNPASFFHTDVWHVFHPGVGKNEYIISDRVCFTTSLLSATYHKSCPFSVRAIASFVCNTSNRMYQSSRPF